MGLALAVGPVGAGGLVVVFLDPALLLIRARARARASNCFSPDCILHCTYSLCSWEPPFLFGVAISS